MLTRFDPFPLRQDRYAAFAAVRAAGGAALGPPPFPGLADCVYVFNHHLASAALRHPKLLQAPPGTYDAVRAQLVGHRILAVLARSMLLTDPPRHLPMRRVAAPLMTPGKAAELAQFMREEANKLALAARAKHRFDAVYDLAVPFAMQVLGRILGMRLPPPGALKPATIVAGAAFDMRHGDIAPEANEACRQIERAVEDGLAGPLDPDGLAAVMLAEVEAGRWEREDLIGNLVFLLLAGQATTVDSFTNALADLDAAPDQRALLDDRTVSWKTAADELLRIGAPVLYAGVRIAAEDTEVEGIVIPAGSGILPCLASANRDEAVFPAGDRLRLDAPRPAGMTFSTGLHFCPGQHFARLEIATLLQALFETMPRWRLDRAAAEPHDSALFRGFAVAPVEAD